MMMNLIYLEVDMPENDSYQQLAKQLDSFPHGFPSSETGEDIAILSYLFTPEEAALAARLMLEPQPLTEAALSVGMDIKKAKQLVKQMAGKGLVAISRGESGILVRLYPFVVGFYEHQVNRMDETFAALFEAYYQKVFHDVLRIQPQFHRVIPINVSLKPDIDILPESDLKQILSEKKAWAVLDCICRKQQALIGEGCDHPVHVCLAMSDFPGAFDRAEGMDAVDLDGALAVLAQAADAGLVHTVANHKSGVDYVCSCCTCSCALLRGLAEKGLSNVVARSPYLAWVDDALCTACGTCEVMCQVAARTVMDAAEVDRAVCTGCGVCVRACPEEAIQLDMREREAVLPMPEDLDDWMRGRRQARGR